MDILSRICNDRRHKIEPWSVKFDCLLV